MIDVNVTLGVFGEGFECEAPSGRYFADSGVVIAPDGKTVGEYDTSDEIGTQMNTIGVVVGTVEGNLHRMAGAMATGTIAA